jgi:hypothetical protein
VLSGIRKVVADVVEEMTASGESVPEPLSEKSTAGDLWFAYQLWFTEPLQPKPPNKA